MKQTLKKMNVKIRNFNIAKIFMHLVCNRNYDYMRNIRFYEIKRLVFVCKGNVCRSPYAEAVAKKKGVQATSCGIDVRKSCSPELNAIKSAFAKGVDISLHKSKSVVNIKLNYKDLLVMMEPNQIAITQNIAASNNCQMTLLGLWSKQPDAKIFDPYGGPMECFDACYSQIDQCLEILIQQYQKSANPRK